MNSSSVLRDKWQFLSNNYNIHLIENFLLNKSPCSLLDYVKAMTHLSRDLMDGTLEIVCSRPLDWKVSNSYTVNLLHYYCELCERQIDDLFTRITDCEPSDHTPMMKADDVLKQVGPDTLPRFLIVLRTGQFIETWVDKLVIDRTNHDTLPLLTARFPGLFAQILLLSRWLQGRAYASLPTPNWKMAAFCFFATRHTKVSGTDYDDQYTIIRRRCSAEAHYCLARVAEHAFDMESAYILYLEEASQSAPSILEKREQELVEQKENVELVERLRKDDAYVKLVVDEMFHFNELVGGERMKEVRWERCLYD